MGRLIVVSNRVADLTNPSQSGGLVVALADALMTRGGIWFGWNGKTTDDPDSEGLSVERVGSIEKVGVPLTQADFDNYYVGYANSVLWPLFHYRIDLVDYSPAFFEGYRRVNQRFAANLQPLVKADDLVWVHDYHLIPLARNLRRRGCRNAIGFFLHIPFPPPEILSAAPRHADVVKAMLDYDMIGFQTTTDVQNFRRYVETTGLGTLAGADTIAVGQRIVTARRVPIGIDVDNFAELSRRPNEDVRIEQMRRHMLKRKQIIGVDRLDYSKGIPARFQAFERLLNEHPDLERRVSFLQIAPPTRETIDAYSRIRGETEGLAGAINGRFADFDWTPIRYIHRSIGRDKLASLFRTSHVGFVTPLRDGMNLVAKEYVAAQPDENPGVLVLSRFAGAAEEMEEALLVNPHDIDEMARGLHTALTMPLEERQERHRALLDRVRTSDVKTWADGFLEALSAAAAQQARPVRKRTKRAPAVGGVGPGGLGYLMTLSLQDEETIGIGPESHSEEGADQDGTTH